MFYSVHKGKQPGIYSTWNECKEQTQGYPNPIFKKFENRGDAEFFLKNGFTNNQQVITIPRGYYTAYTDGSFKKTKDGPKCGYGVYFGKDDSRNISRPFTYDNPTNNRAELLAILECLNVITKEGRPYVILTDSKYSYDSLTKFAVKWEKNDWRTVDCNMVKNKEFIKPIYDILRQYPNIKLQHLNSHTGFSDIYSKGNSEADKLANIGCK